MSIAVIIPVFNSAALLRGALLGLRQGSRQPDELWVVDDGSTDDSAQAAEEFGARVLRMPANAGPAACRNEAAWQASSDVLIFVDADTYVHFDTLELLEKALLENPSVAAVFGSYDERPIDGSACSQYRNLAHCYVHRMGRRNALTFWTGCGAIRRSEFLRRNGFDERHRRPSGEDIELGYRLTGSGLRIVLDPAIQVTHAKRWTLWGAIVTDVRDRGMPWITLLRERGAVPDDLNLTVANRLSTILTGVILVCVLAIGVVPAYALWMGSAALFCGVVASAVHIGLFRFLCRRKGISFLPASLMFFFIQQMCNIASVIFSLPALLRPVRKGERVSRIAHRRAIHLPARKGPSNNTDHWRSEEAS